MRAHYSEITDDFHISEHRSTGDLQLLISQAYPKFLLPISDKYRQVATYRELAVKMGYPRRDIFIAENGQKIIFTKTSARFEGKIDTKNVCLDEVSGEEVKN